MSISFAVTGVLQPPKSTALTTTNETDVLNPDVDQPHTIVELSVLNVDASNAAWLKLFWNDGTTSNQFFYKSIAANSSEAINIALPMLLNPRAGNGNGVAKKLVAQAENANDLTVTVIYTITQPQKTGESIARGATYR